MITYGSLLSISGNIAFLKPTSQSSTPPIIGKEREREGNSALAVDGYTDKIDSVSQTCTRTKTEDDPWFRVDLLKPKYVERVSTTYVDNKTFYHQILFNAHL